MTLEQAKTLKKNLQIINSFFSYLINNDIKSAHKFERKMFACWNAMKSSTLLAQDEINRINYQIQDIEKDLPF